jgi:hypothetical protein
MVTKTHRVKHLSLAMAMATLCGCSLVLDWAPDGLPCDTEKKCADGFSCLVNRCVAEGSLAVGDTCSASAQCEDYPTNICGSNPFTCRKRCQDNYLSNTAGICLTGEYCRPEAERDKPTTWTGTCVASECTGNDQCRDRTPASNSKACVAVSPSANSCLQTCSVAVSGGVYSDTCGSSNNQVYCQPVGPKASQSLVCLSRLDNNVTGLPNTGDPCRLVDTPCRPGAACTGDSGTFCRIYCDVGANDLSNGNAYCPQPGSPSPAPYCCAVTNGAGALYAVCMPNGC